MAASILRRLAFWRPLYTPQEVEMKLACLLKNTFSRYEVAQAICEINHFNAGAVDLPLQRHVYKVLRRLIETDTASDGHAIQHIREALEGGE